MTVAWVILGIVFVLLLFLFLLQRFEMLSITKQLRRLRGQDTNELVHSAISRSLSDELINEINGMLREMRRSRICYQQKNHNLEQMIINISHDLRTPLTSAMGYVGIIRNSALPQEEKDREIEIIEKRLLRLEELLDAFFEFSKIISSDRLPDMEELNLTAVLEEAMVLYYDDYCAKGREIIYCCDASGLSLWSNRNMLMRIFDNLISNALRHGVGNLKVSVKKEDGVRIYFENTLSVSKLDMECIFDEFYTTDISRTKGNTGLGLAIAKQFTELLGGVISAESREGKFVVTIAFTGK